MDRHGSFVVDEAGAGGAGGAGCVSLCDAGLRRFVLAELVPTACIGSAITSLVLDQNELWDLPGIEQLGGTLRTLSIARNWFEALPPGISALMALVHSRKRDCGLNLRSAFLKPVNRGPAANQPSGPTHAPATDTHSRSTEIFMG